MISTTQPNSNAAPADWRALARAGQFVDAVAALVEETRPMTLLALQKHLDGYFYPTYGTTLLRNPANLKEVY